MNNEQLYIDNQLVDTDGKTKVTLDIKSNLLQDISKIVSNHTYTIRLPKTTRNQRIVKHADLVSGMDNFAYNVHVARYFRNGVEIIRNGRAVMMQAGEDMELSIVWGLFPAFSDMVSRGVTLNQLESDARILWTGNDEADNYADALEADYFYAGLNMMRSIVISKYWNWSYTKTDNKQGEGTIRPGGRPSQTMSNLHPCVKVSWVLEQIQSNLGVGFVWTGDAKDYIDSLILPLINKKANELTFHEKLEATLPAISGTTLGELHPEITSSIAAIRETSGSVTQLTIVSDVTLHIDVKARATYDLNDYHHYGNIGWNYNGCFVDMKVTKTDGTELHYQIGDKRGTEGAGYRVANFADYPDKVIEDNMTGGGVLEFDANDKITFAAYYCQWTGFGRGDYYGRTTPSGYHPKTTFHGATIEIGVVSNDGSVPTGGYYPIAYNLPNIKCIDFVKFLACITGTFPLQIADDTQVQFVALSSVWNNLANALDWTSKLVAAYPENKPKEMEYKLSEWKQNNWYRWKEDDTVSGNYDGDLQIGNDTLELERDVITFPFAATDGNNIPLYEKKTESDGTVSYDYKACKDRVLRLADDGNGKAAGVFDIDMQSILEEKYQELARTLQDVKVLRERVVLSDAEIQQFDETKPVYLSQYGRYFAVLEIKSDGEETSEVTLLQLKLENE
jgi:hypothetical protein